MNRTRIIIGAALMAAVASCISRPGTLDRSLAPGAQWTALITPTASSGLHGSMTFVKLDPPGQTRVVVALAGGIPGAILPWHVHYGRCGDNGLIVGEPGAYPPFILNTMGSVDAVAQLPIELSTKSQYFLHVHASASDMKTVAACAALVPGGAVTKVARATP